MEANSISPSPDSFFSFSVLTRHARLILIRRKNTEESILLPLNETRTLAAAYLYEFSVAILDIAPFNQKLELFIKNRASELSDLPPLGSPCTRVNIFTLKSCGNGRIAFVAIASCAVSKDPRDQPCGEKGRKEMLAKLKDDKKGLLLIGLL